MAPMGGCVALLLAFTALAACDSGTERMKAEISASGGAAEPAAQSQEMADAEAKAIAGLAQDVSDALTDIMAVLLHGSDTSKDHAIERLIDLAMASGDAGNEQARLFRSAVVAGGALPALIAVLASPEPRRQYLAVSALHALALDDPTTDEDNFHQLEICQAGAVPPLVRLLESGDERMQASATGALSALAENPTCQALIASEGAVAPLVSLASYGSDLQKLGALNTLDVLTVNNPGVRGQLQEQGAPQLLQGLEKFGSPLLRDSAAGFGTRLGAAPAAPLSEKAHIKAARETRVHYDGVRRRAFRLMQGWPGDGRARGAGAEEGASDD